MLSVAIPHRTFLNQPGVTVTSAWRIGKVTEDQCHLGIWACPFPRNRQNGPNNAPRNPALPGGSLEKRLETLRLECVGPAARRAPVSGIGHDQKDDLERHLQEPAVH